MTFLYSICRVQSLTHKFCRYVAKRSRTIPPDLAKFPPIRRSSGERLLCAQSTSLTYGGLATFPSCAQATSLTYGGLATFPSCAQATSLAWPWCSQCSPAERGRRHRPGRPVCGEGRWHRQAARLQVRQQHSLPCGSHQGRALRASIRACSQGSANTTIST